MTPEEYKKALRDAKIYTTWDKLTKQKFDYAKKKAQADYLAQVKLGKKPDFNSLWEQSISEAESVISAPVTTEFGDIEERKGVSAPPINVPTTPGAKPTITTALKPQQVIPEPRAEITKTYKVDFDAIAKQLEEQGGLAPQEATNQSKAMRVAFSEIKRANKGISDEDAIKKTIEEIQGISNVKQIKDKIEGPQDPYFVAFSQQVTGGGIPDYTPAQQAFIKEQSKIKVDDYIKENLPQIKKQAHKYYSVALKSGSKVKVPVEVYDYMTETTLPPTIYSPAVDKMIKEGKASFFTELEGRPQERDMQAIAKIRGFKELGGGEWYLDAEKKKKVLADPEKYTEQGFFTDVTPIGGERETVGAWAIRSALAPFNLIAGVAVEALSSEDLKGVREKYRKEEQPLYADNPVLANIALNKGFTGEAQETADALNIEDPLLRYTMIGGGFAADILDPTFAIVSGAAKGAQTASKLRKAQKAIYGKTNIKDIATATTKAFGAEVLDDFNLISETTKLVFPKAKEATKSLVHGDIRLHMADDLSRKIREQRASGIVDETEFVAGLEKGGIATPEIKSLAKELQDTQKYVKEISENGLQSAQKLASSERLRLNKTTIDDVVVAVVGKTKEITPNNWPQVQKAIDDLYSRAIVFEATPGMKSLENIQLVTRNTWAHKDRVPSLLADAVNTPIGKTLNELSSVGKLGEAVKPAQYTQGSAFKTIERFKEGEITPYYKITPQQAQIIKDEIELLPIKHKDFIINQLNQGRLYADDHTALIHANIDQTAKRTQEGIVTKEDISRLPAKEQQKVLEAREVAQRKWGITDAVKDLYSSVSKKVLKQENQPSIPATLKDATLEQRRLVKEIQQEASTLDTKAKRMVNSLVKSEQVRASYGITGEINRQQALGAIIVGVKQDAVGRIKQAQTIEETLKWSFARLFYSQKTFESLVDRVSGLSRLYDNSLLNANGKRLLADTIEEASQQMIDNPSRFWDIYNRFVADWADNLDAGVVDGKRIINTDVRRSDIQKITGDKLKKTKAEIGLGMYYYGESSRILDKKLFDVVDTEFTPTTTKEIFPGKTVSDSLFQDATKQAIAINYNRSLPYEEQLAKLRTLTQDDDISRKAIEYAEIITRKNNLSDFVVADVGEIKMLVDDIFGSDNANFSRLVFGEEYYNQINKTISDGRASSLTRNLDEILRESATTQRGLNAAKKAMNFIASFRYTVLLGLRPRFHGSNTITANAIMYSTTGKMIGPKYAKKGFDVAFFSAPNASKANKIAVRTPAGEAYTYGQIYEAVRVSGARSEFNFITSAVNDGSLISWLKANDGKKKGFGEGVFYALEELANKAQDLTVLEDVTFRAGLMMKALEEGRGIEEATALARRSLFDYNDMGAAEKSIASYYFIFYSFMRQNFVNFLNALDKPKTMKRYLNILKFDRGVEALAVELNDGKAFPHEIFFPDYTAPRQVLSVQQGEEKDWYVMGPPIPAIDAILLAADIAKGNISELVSKQLAPQYKLILGLESSFKGGRRIPSEYINLISMTYSEDPLDIADLMSKVVGGSVVPVSTSSENGAVNGYVYPLTPAQQKRWAVFTKFTIDFVGLSTTAKDYSKIFVGEGTTAQKLSPSERALYAIGATTPTAIASPAQQDYWALKAREAAINERLKLLRSGEYKGEDELIMKQIREK